MGIEIERKFLIDTGSFMSSDPQAVISVAEFNQGYLSKDPWVRIRLAEGVTPRGNRAWLTVKGMGAPVSPEWEYAIPIEDAEGMYKLCKGKLSKIRREVSFEGHTWEVDEFLGALHGFWLAEIELGSLDEPFAKPLWVREEVTGDPRYSNGWLAEHGIPPR